MNELNSFFQCGLRVNILWIRQIFSAIVEFDSES